MSRRRAAEKREVLPDPKYKSLLFTKFVNSMMLDGKKAIAERITYGALDEAANNMKEEQIKILEGSIDNVKPDVEVRSRRVGGATYQVPMEVRPKRAQSLAIRWLIQAARSRNEKTMIERLAAELMDAYNNRGSAIKKREDTHKMADANKAFAHFKW